MIHADSNNYYNPDTKGYVDLAKNIVYQHEFRSDYIGSYIFPADLLRPPGYPIFLALINFWKTPNHLHIAIVQSLIGALITVFLVIFIGKIFSNFKMGMIAGLLYAFDYLVIIHTPIVITDTLLTLFLGIAIYSFFFYLNKTSSLKYFSFAIILLCISAHIKPVVQFPLFICIFFSLMIFGKDYLKRISIIVLSISIILLPWMYRNYNKYELFTMSPISSEIAYFFVGIPATDYELFNLNIESWKKLEIKNLEMVPVIYKNAKNYKEIKEYMMFESKKMIIKNIPTFIKQSVIGLSRVMLGSSYSTYLQQSGYKFQNKIVIIYIPLVFNIIMWLFVFLAMIKFMFEKDKIIFTKKSVIFLFLVIFLGMMTSANAVGSSKYRVIYTPFIIFFEVLFLHYILLKFKQFKMKNASRL